MNKAALLFLFAGFSAAMANPPVVISQPAPTATVTSPLTPPTAQANQSLLNQINGTLIQRRTEHQIITTNAILNARTPVFSPTSRAGR